MPIPQLPRAAMIVEGILLVVITLVVLSCSNPQPPQPSQPVSQPQPVQQPPKVQQDQPGQQAIVSEQEVPDITSPAQVSTQSTDILKIEEGGLVLKNPPANPAIGQSTKTIQLKDPVQGMEKELDGWMDESSGLNLKSVK